MTNYVCFAGVFANVPILKWSAFILHPFCFYLCLYYNLLRSFFFLELVYGPKCQLVPPEVQIAFLFIFIYLFILKKSMSGDDIHM